MRTGNYDLLTILEDQGLEQFLIPEIQRDYVWQIRDVQDFLDYIKQGHDGDASDKPYLGFIYAYNDRDYPYKYILIDGQQRLTTIFLLLLAAHQKIGRGLPEYMFTRDKLKLEYKVRQATHDFMQSLITFCSKNPGLDFNIRDQIWYHKEYSSDRTINNIINNFSFINKWLDSLSADVPSFVKFIEDGISLSYFDIEETRQGEDLYIYMNSRGRQLEPNETLKARYLATTQEKDSWGTTWEKWQDFFWRHKHTKPDADAGFNDFLRMVQVLTMSKNNDSSESISNFVSGKTDTDPSFEKLPQSIEDLGKIYEAYEWFINVPAIDSMYQALEGEDNYLTVIPKFDKRQVYFLRLLPVIVFLYASGCREEIVTLRFARFFYNIARKKDSIGKDIANQLPSAIKLMLEYGGKKQDHFDVCDLVEYTKGRSVLIDDEEVLKLTILRSNPDDRLELEKLFWEVEDHAIFDGEISFLLSNHYNAESNEFKLAEFKNSWATFQNIFNKQKEHNKVALALLYYGNTWIEATPHYYQNYACMNWRALVRSDKSKPLMLLINTISQTRKTLDQIIESKIKNYFVTKGLNSVDTLKQEKSFFQQVRILAAIDFHTVKRFFTNSNGHVAKDNRYTYGDKHFFINEPELFNVGRYINDGSDGRLMRNMRHILQDTVKLQEVIDGIIN